MYKLTKQTAIFADYLSRISRYKKCGLRWVRRINKGKISNIIKWLEFILTVVIPKIFKRVKLKIYKRLDLKSI